MKITLTRALAGHTNGATIDRNRQVAEHLIAAGAAIETEPDKPTKPTKGDATSTKAKQTRRSKSRNEQPSDSSAKIDEDKPAGQEGGGGPLDPPAPTAG